MVRDEERSSCFAAFPSSFVPFPDASEAKGGPDLYRYRREDRKGQQVVQEISKQELERRAKKSEGGRRSRTGKKGSHFSSLWIRSTPAASTIERVL